MDRRELSAGDGAQVRAASVVRLGACLSTLLEQKRVAAAEELCRAIATWEAAPDFGARLDAAVLRAESHAPPSRTAPPRWLEVVAILYLLAIAGGILFLATDARHERAGNPDDGGSYASHPTSSDQQPR